MKNPIFIFQRLTNSKKITFLKIYHYIQQHYITENNEIYLEVSKKEKKYVVCVCVCVGMCEIRTGVTISLIADFLFQQWKSENIEMRFFHNLRKLTRI